MQEEGRKGFINDTFNTFLVMVIWHQTYGKRPLRQQEEGRKGFINDTFNTFLIMVIYYSMRHMVKDYSDSERNPASSTWTTLIN